MANITTINMNDIDTEFKRAVIAIAKKCVHKEKDSTRNMVQCFANLLALGNDKGREYADLFKYFMLEVKEEDMSKLITLYGVDRPQKAA